MLLPVTTQEFVAVEIVRGAWDRTSWESVSFKGNTKVSSLRLVVTDSHSRLYYPRRSRVACCQANEQKTRS